MISAPTSAGRSFPTQSRQKPGAACEECRRRKLRCDRQQPQCGTCVEDGVECIFSPFQSSRGPKRGHLKLLQTRIGAVPLCLSLGSSSGNRANALIAELERRLTQQQSSEGCVDLGDEKIEVDRSSTEDQTYQAGVIDGVEVEASPPDPFQGTKAVDSSVSLPEACISDLMQAELYVLQNAFHDQLKNIEQQH